MSSKLEELHYLLGCEFRAKRFTKKLAPLCFREKNPREECNSETCPLAYPEEEIK
jgi:hypothetical protein